MNTIWQDLRYGVRILLKNPGVTVAAVITLALGIGANTAIFSVVDAVMLRPLPYKNPERVVSLWENVPTYGRWRVTPANYLDWKQQNTVFEDVAAFGATSMTLTGDGEPEQLLGTRASAGYFEVVGVQPMLGRSFVKEEYEPGKGRVVILGAAFWRSRFHGNPAIINKAITLNGASFTVVGVMPQGVYPVWATAGAKVSFNENEQQIWTPMSFTAEWAGNRTSHVLGVIARLKPDKTLEQAAAEMSAIGARLERDHAANKGEGILVNSLMDEVIGKLKPALVILLSAVLLVLLIACANIAGLLLAQHAGRSKEIAIRAALGANRARLVRQFFLEGFLLSLLGTAAGVMLAQFGVSAMLKLMPADIPRLNQVHLDFRVLGFTLLLALITTFIFGLVPAWQASKTDLHSTLEQGGRSSGPHSGRQRFRQSLVVLQVAVAVLLVVSAGLLLKSFWRLSQVDPGFKKENLLSLSLTLPHAKYGDGLRINSFYNDLLDRISNLPGVEAAAIAYDQPLQSNWIDAFAVEGRPQDQIGGAASANFIPVSWDYFRTVGAEIVRGRHFTPQDNPDHPGVVIVNEAFARRYFPNEPALGQRLRISAPPRLWNNQRLTSFEVVGIARDVKAAGLNAGAEPAYYVPSTQAPLQDMTILVRTQGDPATLVSAIRSSVWAIDPNQPVSNVNTLEKLVNESIAQPRLNMMLMGLFGVLALLLAAVGIYGLLSYAVTQRTQEIGIRMALGAQVSDVLAMILRQGMTLAVIGIGLGLVGALALTRLMRGLLFGVGPTDATTFILVSGVLITVGLIACYLPARRAARVDPLVALRYE